MRGQAAETRARCDLWTRLLVVVVEVLGLGAETCAAGGGVEGKGIFRLWQPGEVCVCEASSNGRGMARPTVFCTGSEDGRDTEDDIPY